MQAQIALLPGDGIGVDVTREGRKVLEAISKEYGHEFYFEELMIGGCAIDNEGDPLPSETLKACRRADAVLLGAVGGPKWDDPNAHVRPEQGLLRLRYGLGLFANLRPIKVYDALSEASPLRPEKLENVDLLIVRELMSGLYYGKPSKIETVDGEERATDTLTYSAREIKRVIQLAFRMAMQRRRKLTVVDKANVLQTSRLWRKVAVQVAKDFPEVSLEFQLVDSASMRVITSAASLDVLVTENMFGDILSDEASVLVGSLGMVPSAALGEGSLGLYEPVHGSAPDIAGKGLANPVGAILSAAMLLRYSLDLAKEAESIDVAVGEAINQGARTMDLGGELSTEAMGDEVCRRLTAIR